MAKITFTSVGGTEVTITTARYLHKVSASAYMGNTRFQGLPSLPKAGTQLAINLKKAGYEGYYTMSGSKASLAIDPETALKVLEAVAREQAEYDATPERAMEILIEKRTNIICSINSYMRCGQDAEDRGYESSDGTGRWARAGKPYYAKADESREELAKFDAEHPEVVAEIERQRDENIEKHLWD